MGDRAYPNARLLTLVVGVSLILPTSRVWARPTTAQQAEKVVTGWLSANPQPLGATLGQRVGKVETFISDGDTPIYYVVYLDPSGFVIVPADDLLEPIIGFAHDGTYDPSLENPLGALVTNDLGGRVEAVRDTHRPRATRAMEKALKSQHKWEQLENIVQGPVIMGLPSVSDVRVAPLVQSKWGQSTVNGLACYNYYTPPYTPNTPSNYPCGCVATALAQLMRFHEYPISGIGTHSFLIYVNDVLETAWTRGGDGAGGPYDWTQMALEPDSNSTATQRQAIGTLCYDAGISVNMRYTSSSSGSDTLKVKDALTSTFGYSNGVKGYNGGNNIGTGLNGMVNPNLDWGHPVMLGITGTSGGHAVIADGYGYDLSTLYHHLNMGWSGSDDAWYNLPDIDSSPSFTSVYKCVYNIFVSGSGEIISGRIVDVNQEPISEATVTVQGPGDPNSAITNAEGIYALAKLASASTYTTAVSKDGYTFGPPKPVTTGVSGGSTSGNRWAVDFEGTGGHYPVIQTIPDQLEFSVMASDPPPEPQILSVRNSGFGALHWVADCNCNWLEADPCEGISTGDINEVTLGVDTTGMALGSYNCQLTLSDPCAFNSPKTVQVNLSIGNTLLVPSQYSTIQAAIDAAVDNCTIIVADGTYTGPGNRDIDFNGLGITLRSENGPEHCIIDCNAADTDRHRGFHFHNGEGQSSVLDGFTITNGYGPNDEGGGICCCGASPTVKNCIISGCTAGNIGSGLYNYGGGMATKDGSSPTLINCTFSGNSAQYGGGLHNRYSSPTMANCAFSENSAKYAGGMYNYGSTPTLTDCIFSENSADYAGAVYIRWDSRLTLSNCTFSGNSASQNNGGGIFNEGDLMMNDCAFSVNSAAKAGGGIYNGSGNMTITDCTFYVNSADKYGGGISNLRGASTLTNCTLSGNSTTGGAGYGGGVHNHNSSPILVNCAFNANTADRNGAGMYNEDSSPTLTNCSFSGNSAGRSGGGMVNFHDSSPTLTNCAFSENRASSDGGGMDNRGGIGVCAPTMTNCTFSGNSANDKGGGMHSYQSEPKLVNCIFSGNSAGNEGGGMQSSYYSSTTMTCCTFAGNSSPHGKAVACDSFLQGSPSSVQVTNCILWDGGNEIWNNDGSTITVTYSDVQGGWSGTGNINSNPRFVTGPESDYYLSQIAAGQAVDSPCLDAGSDLAENLGMDVYTTRTDQLRDAGMVDMGYHYEVAFRSADADENWHVDFRDYAFLAADWLQCMSPYDVNYLAGDITRSGCVDVNDLAHMMDCWLQCYMGTADNPYPQDNTTGADPNGLLNWSAAEGTLYHDVYLGTDTNAVAEAGPNSIEFVGTVADPCLFPGPLERETHYYWRIDEVGPACTAKGLVWDFTTAAEPNFSRGLVSHWKFDEGSETTAYDSAGTNHGTLMGDPNWVGGYVGSGALDFDGDGDYVDVPDDLSLRFSQYDSFTLSFWAAPAEGGYILSKMRTAEQRGVFGYQTSWSATSRFSFVIDWSMRSSTIVSTSDGSAPPGVWYHVTAVYDNTDMKIYLNGQLGGSGAFGGGTGSTTPDKNLAIGARSYDWTITAYYGGIIDDVRIYDRALNAEEIQQLYQEGGS